jgi:hypothetical protein
MLLSEHCHIQPSEWDKMPYSQMQTMIASKINNSNAKANDNSNQPQNNDLMFKSQQNMLKNMQQSMKMPSFKLPKAKI